MKRTSILKLLLATAVVAAAVGVGSATVASAHNVFCLGAACPASDQGVVPTSTPGNVHCPEGTAAEVDFAQSELLPSPGTTKSYSFDSVSGTVTVIVSGGHASFTVTGGAVATIAMTHGGNGQGGTNATNIYTYTNTQKFPAGGVVSDGSLHFSGPQSNVFICLGESLVLGTTTTSLHAQSHGRAVTVAWRTASEANVIGFNVYRLVRGHMVKANHRIIAAASLSKSSTSHAYSFRTVLRSRKLAASSRFVLAEVHANGSRTLYGPVRASAS